MFSIAARAKKWIRRMLKQKEKGAAVKNNNDNQMWYSCVKALLANENKRKLHVV